MSGRLITVLVLASLALPLPANQQKTRQIPEHLRLKGDPASRFDLGSKRIVPVGRRKPGSAVTRAAYRCRRCVRQGVQTAPERIFEPETLLGRPLSAVLPYLNNLTPDGDATIISTRHAVLVGLLDKGAPSAPTPEELVRLRVFFPDLDLKAKKLSGHQRAHLWAIRFLHDQAALGDLMSLDATGALAPNADGSRPVPHLRFETYCFTSVKEHGTFVNHVFPRGTEPLVGALLADGPVPVPASAVLLSGAAPRDLARRFAFSTTLLALTRHRRMAGGLPPWVMLGMAHFMEQRIPGKSGRYDAAGILPGADKAPGNWRQVVRDMVLARRAADVSSLTAAGFESMTPQLRIQSEALVRFLAGAGLPRFGVFLGVLYRTPVDRPRVLAMADAIKAAYGVDVPTLDRAWRAWAGGRKRS